MATNNMKSIRRGNRSFDENVCSVGPPSNADEAPFNLSVATRPKRFYAHPQPSPLKKQKTTSQCPNDEVMLFIGSLQNGHC